MKCLSGSMLKTIALITMLIDHVGSIIISSVPLGQMPVLSFQGHTLTFYWLLRFIGRVSFPIYCFLITEGFIHTSNRKRYGINLLAFAVISEIPWNLEHSGHWHHGSQNVFFTLFFGYVGLCCLEKYKENISYRWISILSLFALTLIFRADYREEGFCLILAMYVLRDKRELQAIVGSCLTNIPYITIFAFLPINMYNGKRGFIKGKFLKYAFYAAYPLHITILYLIKRKYIGY